MVAKFSVRKSSFGDLRGVEQYVMSERIALQVLSTIIDFNAYLRSKGRSGSLSVNEGMRSRPRQSYLWNNRFALGVVVAQPFTSRHDEVLHGNAIDFGITMPDGSNRALYDDEFARLHQIVEGRGGTWTGRFFNEPWHHEFATRAEAVPPYPDARALLAAKPSKPDAKPAPTPEPAPEPEPLPLEDDMLCAKSTDSGNWYVIWARDLDTIRKTDKNADEKARAVSQARGVSFVEMSSARIKLLLEILDARVDAANASDKAIVKRAVAEAIRAEA